VTSFTRTGKCGKEKESRDKKEINKKGKYAQSPQIQVIYKPEFLQAINSWGGFGAG
jgi:hypothetical protein